jgi:hypothetical protein
MTAKSLLNGMSAVNLYTLYERTGHASKSILQNTAREMDLKLVGNYKACDTCGQMKAIRKHVRETAVHRESRKLKHIYVDATGPFSPSSYGKYEYIIQYIDEATRYTWSFAVQTLADYHLTLDKFKKTVLDPHFGCNEHITLRSDAGVEFTKGEFRKLVEEFGYTVETTASRDTPQWNGLVEAKIRDVKQRAYCMMKHARGLRSMRKLWVFAFQYASYVSNMLHTQGLPNNIPYRAMWGKDPPIEHLRVWGSICYAAKMKTAKKQLNEKSDKCIFIGRDPNFSESTYLLMKISTRELIRSKDVVFAEDKVGGKDIYTEGFPTANTHTLPDSVLQHKLQPTGSADAAADQKDKNSDDDDDDDTFINTFGIDDTYEDNNEETFDSDLINPNREEANNGTTVTTSLPLGTSVTTNENNEQIRTSRRLNGRHVQTNFDPIYGLLAASDDEFEEYDPALWDQAATNNNAPTTATQQMVNTSTSLTSTQDNHAEQHTDNIDDYDLSVPPSDAQYGDDLNIDDQNIIGTTTFRNHVMHVKHKQKRQSNGTDKVPQTLKQALNSEDREHWIDAVNCE